MFHHPEDVVAARICFEEQKWNKTESFPEYLYQKVILGNNTSVFGKELMGYIIYGKPDKQHRDLAQAQAQRTEQDLFRVFTSISLRDETMTETRKKETKRTTVPSSLKSAVKESVQEDLSTYQKRPQGRQRRNINAIIMKRRITFALSSSRKRKDQRVFAAAIVDIVRSSVEEWEDHVIRIWQFPLFPLVKLDHPTCICRNE